MKDTKLIGEVSEAAAIFHLTKKGYSVSKPFGENQRYDLIVDVNGKLSRVQCKTLQLKNGRLISSLCRVLRTDSGFKKTSYTSSEIDGFVLYSPELDKCYLISLEDSPNTDISLRIEAPKNNQVQNVRWAKDYEI